ncbi:MAG: response regulator [Tildeniella nuda ZEHNDER 1965/U140]|jgi:signal transduction histidine kinase/DNA-binding response OmpR family regulator|nr:response regulator [Tildeniella nuda ZEHNDER 1965/U140]
MLITATAIPSTQAIAMATTRANVLIVDDQPDNLRTLSAMLTQRGYKVRKAISGEVALETARLDPPSLILLDINMPHMNGYEVCSVLKQATETSDIPVIFLSALDDVVDKVKAFTAGGADYITKPFQAEEVLVRVQHQLTIQCQQHQLQQEIQERRYAEELLRLQLQREKLLADVTNYIRETVDLEEILAKTVAEIRALLHVDRVLVCQLTADDTLKVIAESVPSPNLSLLGQTLQNPCVQTDWRAFMPHNTVSLIEDIHSAPASSDGAALCTLLHVQANAVLSIQQADEVWGFLMAHNCTESRLWETWETEMLQRLTVQLAIAIRQANLYQAAQVQIEDLRRLNQIRDDLLDAIFHELRTPIANIKLATRLLTIATHRTPNLEETLAQPGDKDKITRYLNILQDECERELHLIQDLLDLHHLEVGAQPLELVPIDLNHWIPCITEPFELRMQNQQQTFSLELDPTLPLIHTDSFYLSRILTELVNNACKYTPAGATIAIAACIEADSLKLSVTNTGVEISTEECALIFDRFYRIRNCDVWQSGGTGLGLSLVQRLVEYLNGSIQVMSANQQTCFTVKLPLALG